MSLQKEIYNKLKAIEAKTYFIYFPVSFQYGTDKGIVFDLINTSNTNTFEGKELVKEWTLTITINYCDYDYIADTLIPAIKTAIYSIERDRANVISLVNEDHDYSNELKCYEYYLEFNIK